LLFVRTHVYSTYIQMNEVDGTPNKTNIGANAILAVSMAVSVLIHYTIMLDMTYLLIP
jgi:hypothetical protein